MSPPPQGLTIRHGWFWIMLVVLIAYWPLSSFQYGLNEGDTLDCWLPWRHFITASLKDGHLPMWNPLQQMGYPVHADLQGPAWYPEALILGGTIGHGPHLLQLLFLAYVILGGCGMRMLSRTLLGDDRAALITGIAYSLSGFFTAHAMHFYAIISGAWLPWLIWSILRLLKDPTPRKAWAVAIFLFLLLTGGNHTFLIIAFWPILFITIHALWQAWRVDRKLLKRMIAHLAMAVAAALIMSAGTLHALIEVSPYIERVRGLDLEKAQQGHLTFTALKTLLWPAAGTAGADELGTGPTMANAWMGALLLLMAAAGLRRIGSLPVWVLLVSGAIAALAAMGPLLPVHGALWKFVPGMDLFRFPAYFRYFTMLGLLPVAGLGIMRLLNGDGRRSIMLLASGVVVLSLIVFIRNADMGHGDPDAPLLERMRSIPVGTLMYINGALTGIIMLLFIWWLSHTRRSFRPLVLLVAMEMILAIQFTQWHTTLGVWTPGELAWRIGRHSTGPVVPRLHPVGLNVDDSQVMHLLWRNTQTFQGAPTHGGFNSFWLVAHLRLERDHVQLTEELLARPLVHFQDDPAGERPGTIGMTHFDLNAMRLVYERDRQGVLVVQQNLYPGWEILVDNSSVDVTREHFAAFGAVVPAGVHDVEIRYRKPLLKILLHISYAVFFLLLFHLAIGSPHRYKLLALVTMLLAGWCWSIFAHSSKVERMAAGWKQVERILEDMPEVAVVVNTDRPLPHVGERLRTFRIDLPDEIAPLERMLAAGPPELLLVAWHGLPLNEGIWSHLTCELGYTKTSVNAGNADAGAWLLQRGSREAGSLAPLYFDAFGEGTLLTAGEEPWTPAWRMGIGDLREQVKGPLVVDLRFRGRGAAGGRLIFERRRHGQITDHESIPLTPDSEADDDWHSLVAVRPLPHQRFSGEELGIYVLQTTMDTLWVKDLRVRTVR